MPHFSLLLLLHQKLCAAPFTLKPTCKETVLSFAMMEKLIIIPVMQLSIISKMETMSLGKLSRLSATLKLHIHPALPQQATPIANIMLPGGLIEPVEAMLI